MINIRILIYKCILLVSFTGCTCNEMLDDSKKIIGLWSNQNTATYLDENGNFKPIVTEIDIIPNNTYTVNTVGLTFPLFNYPKVGGEWSYDISNRTIKFFQRLPLNNEILEESSVYWKIRNLNDTLMDVAVTDYNGVFLQDIIYKK